MGWTDFAAALSDHPGRERFLLIGHEPALSRSVESLTGATEVRLREGGLCCVELAEAIEPGAGVLTPAA